MLKCHVDNQLWTMDGQVSFWGATIPTRMTVIRLTDGTLFIHSPVLLTIQLKDRLDVLGQVRYVVSPNKYHHYHMGEYAQAFKKVKMYASPGLREKRKDILFQNVLKNSPEQEWREDIDQVLFMGSPAVQEAIFFHKPSRTLIVGDLCFNIDEHHPFLFKSLGKLLGLYKHLSAGPMIRYTVQDKNPAKLSMQKIMSWNFERIILAHGDIIENNAKEVLKKAYTWLDEN